MCFGLFSLPLFCVRRAPEQPQATEQTKRMSTPARRRLMRDFKQLQEQPPPGISGAPNEDNLCEWTAVIFGPESTSWEGGVFRLALKFTEEVCLLVVLIIFLLASTENC
jgi:hypothetical protein